MPIVHYLNQFFAGLGGEEAASTPPLRMEGAVGPGRALGVAVKATLVCGDDYFAEHEDGALERLLELLHHEGATVLAAGPAFGSGRYGYACGRLAAMSGLPAVAGMHPDNPGVAAADGRAYIVPAPVSVVGMRDVAPAMGRLAQALAEGRPLGSPAEEGYLPRGFRRNTTAKRTGAERAVDALMAKLVGNVTTEVAGRHDAVSPPPAISDPALARFALVTEGGVVPKGNPDRVPSIRARAWHHYGLDYAMTAATHESVHGGFDVGDVNADPNRLLPLDALRALHLDGRVGPLYERFFTTTGNGTPVATARQMGREIAAKLREADIGAVILTAT